MKSFENIQVQVSNIRNSSEINCLRESCNDGWEDEGEQKSGKVNKINLENNSKEIKFIQTLKCPDKEDVQ